MPGRPAVRVDGPAAGVEAPGRLAGSAAITAALQVAAMAIGGVIAVLVVDEFGKTPRSDGVFAAYGLYGLIFVLAGTLRTTIVPRLAEGDLFAALDRYARGVLAIAVAAALPLVLLAAPLAALLTGSLPHAAEVAATSALRIFWLAATAHLIAALGAAALAVRGEFALPGVAYVAGGGVSALLLVALADPLGTDAVPAGLAAGAALTAAIVVARLVRAGYRPRPRGAGTRPAVVMLTGAIPQLIAQIMYVVSIAFASHLRTGSVTLFSYAYFAALLVIGATTFPASVVLAAPLTRGWDRRPQSLEPQLVTVLRAGLMLVAPAVALVGLVGDELIRLLLGGSLTAHDATAIVTTFLILTGIVVTSIATTVPMLAAFATGRYARLALLSAVTAAFHVAANLAAVQAGRIQALAAVSSVDSVVFLLLLLHMTWGPSAWRVAGAVAREVGIVAAAGAAAFGPPALVAAAVGGWGAELAAWAVGAAAFAALVLVALPGHSRVARRMALR
jgi:peptidoglycan biosynthesis protein MviN/MurJ (putative lipid II flippase)